MAKKDKGMKIMAFLALFGIIIGIIGTGLLIIFNGGQSVETEQTLTPEQYQQLQEMIKSQGGSGTLNNTGTTNTGSISLSGTTN
ncbi:MAG: hypothetical protein PHS49_05570 [Candidatus Gracilibacteria bacterium]|nr:hypothetical protein [Candidatus Gracilibacteria bacterium]